MAYKYKQPYTEYHVRAFIYVHCTTQVYRFYTACDKLHIPLHFPRDRDNVWDNTNSVVKYAAANDKLKEFVQVLLEELNRVP